LSYCKIYENPRKAPETKQNVTHGNLYWRRCVFNDPFDGW